MTRSDDVRGGDDLSAIRRDDALLDALGRGEYPESSGDPGEAELLGLFGRWRDTIDTTPTANGPSEDAALEAFERGLEERRPGRRRGLVLLGSTAAALALFAGGTVVGAVSAGGGLPGVGSSTEEGDVALASQLGGDLDRAEAAMSNGNTEEAQRILGSVEGLLVRVDDGKRRGRLEERARTLALGLQATTIITTAQTTKTVTQTMVVTSESTVTVTSPPPTSTTTSGPTTPTRHTTPTTTTTPVTPVDPTVPRELPAP